MKYVLSDTLLACLWLCWEMFLHILPTFFLKNVINQSRENKLEVASSISASDTDLIRFHCCNTFATGQIIQMLSLLDRFPNLSHWQNFIFFGQGDYMQYHRKSQVVWYRVRNNALVWTFLVFFVWFLFNVIGSVQIL